MMWVVILLEGVFSVGRTFVTVTSTTALSLDIFGAPEAPAALTLVLLIKLELLELFSNRFSLTLNPRWAGC